MQDNIVKVDFAAQTSRPIDISKVRSSRRVLTAGLIAPAIEDTSYQLAGEHTSEPIKNIQDIKRMSEWFLSNGKYRDNMLFIVGINFGLRVSDLLTLRFSHLIDDEFRFKTTFPVFEIKTRNTRKVKKNRYITINDAVVDAVTLYLEHTPGVHLSDYMFRSESNRGKNRNMHLTRKSVDKILKDAANVLGFDFKVATHTLRKTFAYHQMLISNHDPRRLLLLQKIFGHSSVAQTLDYIGITKEEVQQAYLDLNLDGRSQYDHFFPDLIEA